jgi:hypothetical protein
LTVQGWSAAQIHARPVWRPKCAPPKTTVPWSATSLWRKNSIFHSVSISMMRARLIRRQCLAGYAQLVV